jgi:hypothetical protein
MEIGELLREKLKLEEELALLINEKASAFTEKTGISISNISIDMVDISVFGEKPGMVVYKAKASLNI